MPPATVALFCICIAFVPLLALGGVAGYLFRPLAMAVVFAMIASYILTYTLVPTMAHFLLANQHPHATQAASRASRAASGFSAAFSEGSSIISRRFRQGYLGLLRLALAHRFVFAGGFVCFALLSLGLAPFLGQDFFPSIDSGAIKIHMRAPTGTRIEETTRADRSGRTENPFDHSARPARERRQQHRPADQRHQPLVPEHGNDRRLRRRHARELARRGRPRPTLT